MIYKTVNYYPISDRGPYVEDSKEIESTIWNDLPEYLDMASCEGWEFCSLAPASFRFDGSVVCFVAVLRKEDASIA